jgi:glycosyltransferase involved in cell wall biosynthesis
MKKILIVTTVPETLLYILKDQPQFLSQYFLVELATSMSENFLEIVTDGSDVGISILDMTRGINPFQDIISILCMIRLLLKLKPDVVHSYTPKAGLVTMIAAWVCHVPVRIHTFTGLIFPTSQGFRQKILIWVDRLICGCATYIVPEGQGVKADLQRYAITRKPLNVIGYGNIAGVDTHYFAPTQELASVELKKKLKIEDSDFVFCFVGRLNRDKGLNELVEAFDKLPQNARLILVGELDVTAPIHSETLATIQSHPRIHWLGFLKDIRPALQSAHVLVLPSYREGFPNIILQACSMELPVIATDINGCNEIIEPDYNGWLVPPHDASSLASTMSVVMTLSTESLKMIGERARIRIQQRFEQSEHWKRMVEFYEQRLDIRE